MMMEFQDEFVNAFLEAFIPKKKWPNDSVERILREEDRKNEVLFHLVKASALISSYWVFQPTCSSVISIRSRNYAFDSNTSSCLSQFHSTAAVCDLLALGLLQTDQDIRSSVLSLLNQVLVLQLSIENSRMTEFYVTQIFCSNTHLLIARCLDLCCNPSTQEGECIEALRCLRSILKYESHLFNKNAILSMVSSLESILRDCIEISKNDPKETRKRRDLVNLAVGLSLNDQSIGSQRRSETYFYPAGLLHKSVALILLELLRHDCVSVVKSHTFSVLFDYMSHCTNEKFTNELFAAILCSVDYSALRHVMLISIIQPLLSDFSVMPFALNSFELVQQTLQLKIEKSKQLLISLTSSWTGLISMASTDTRTDQYSKSGLKCLMNVLQLGDHYVKVEVLQVFSSVLGMGCSDSSLESLQFAQIDSLASIFDSNFYISIGPEFISATFVDMLFYFRLVLFNCLADAGLIKTLTSVYHRYAVLSCQTTQLNAESPNQTNFTQIANSTLKLIKELRSTYSAILPKYFSGFLPKINQKNLQQDLQFEAHDDGVFFNEISKRTFSEHSNEHDFKITTLSSIFMDHLSFLYDPCLSVFRNNGKTNLMALETQIALIIFDSNVLGQQFIVVVQESRMQRKFNLSMYEKNVQLVAQYDFYQRFGVRSYLTIFKTPIFYAYNFLIIQLSLLLITGLFDQ